MVCQSYILLSDVFDPSPGQKRHNSLLILESYDAWFMVNYAFKFNGESHVTIHTRRAGGGDHPFTGFRIYLKNGGAAPVGTFIFDACVKISDPGRSRSGHQVTSRGLTSEKV